MANWVDNPDILKIKPENCINQDENSTVKAYELAGHWPYILQQTLERIHLCAGRGTAPEALVQ